MGEALLDIDRELFFFINSHHAPWLDQLMYYISRTRVWIPLYLIFLFLILKKFRNESWAPLIGIFLTILIADQVASTVMKPLVQRLRPTHDPSFQQLVHIVNGYRGAQFGFASSHAANTFGAACFLWWLFRPTPLWICLMFFWVILVSYSRIYLGVHYPGDILGGFAIGLAAAAIGYYSYQWLAKIKLRSGNLTGHS